MNTEQMRAYIIQISPRAGWKKKVMKMSDGQVFAIYKKEIAKARAPKQTPPKTDNPDIPF